ncbi:MAG: 50S ribosomal protein L24 [Deltaproteobacteria bacterium]|jgi:large subunit ribosomal protein L24|nr:50S ribosomal protein L24 [Deltaproteobacteria bacterium]
MKMKEALKLKVERKKLISKFKKGDRVICLFGKSRGKFGSFERVANNNRVLVEGLNTTIHHVKDTGDPSQKTGRIKMENPMHISNIMPVCPECAMPTRPRSKQVRDSRGKKVKQRICHRCGASLDGSR